MGTASNRCLVIFKRHSAKFLQSPLPGSTLIEFRWRVVQEVLATQSRSSARGVELRRALAKWGVPIRTMQRWVADFESSGGDINSLRNSAPPKAIARRVYVSRDFDRGYLRAGHDPELLHSLQAKVDQLIKAAWASPAQRAGWKQVRREVVDALARHLRNLGIEMPPGTVKLSQRRVREARYFRIVDVRSHDRKTYDDQLPRIRRSNDMLLPMQQIVMDVKVIDCAVHRADGTTAWPRMIAYMDTATQRIFRRFFLLEPSEGIRQEHVAATFLEMVRDPLWGFPQQLYRDNGSEFFIFDLIRSALEQLKEQNVPTVINARPYSAASKPIESKFATLDRFVFSQMGGWTGGDRVRKKIAHLGKPPTPYPRSFAEFIAEADDRICVFESTPIGSGPFKGKTALQLLNEHIDKGWRPLHVPVERIDAAFCTRVTRRVSRGVIKVRGVVYRHSGVVSGQTVTIAVPWRRGAIPLLYVPGEGWARLERDNLFTPLSIEGVRESDRRRREYDAAVRKLTEAAGDIDLEANHRDRLTAVLSTHSVCPVSDAAALPDEAGLGQALARVPVDAEPGVLNVENHKLLETEELERYLASRRTRIS